MTRPKKENIETNLVEAKFDSSPEYFERFQKKFGFFSFREKLKPGIAFPTNLVSAFGLHSLAHDGFATH